MHSLRKNVNSAWRVALMLCLVSTQAGAELVLRKTSLSLEVGGAEQLNLSKGERGNLKWSSSDTKIAQVYENGFVIGLRVGLAKVTARQGDQSADCVVNIGESNPPLSDPAKIQQYADNRVFFVNGRKCVGSELNGQRAVEPRSEEHTSELKSLTN